MTKLDCKKATIEVDSFFKALPKLATDIDTTYIPVIGDGNCAFRAILQGTLTHSILTCTSPQRQLIKEFFNDIFWKHKDTAHASRPELHRIPNELGFLMLMDDFDDVNILDDSLEKFVTDYFPTKLNHDQRTYTYPENDNIIKFLAYCLRLELIPILPEGFYDPKEINEHEYSNICLPQIIERLAEAQINLQISASGVCIESDQALNCVVNVPIGFYANHYTVMFPLQALATAKQILFREETIAQLSADEELARNLQQALYEEDQKQKQILLMQDEALANEIQKALQEEKQSIERRCVRDAGLAIQMQKSIEIEAQALALARETNDSHVVLKEQAGQEQIEQVEQTAQAEEVQEELVDSTQTGICKRTALSFLPSFSQFKCESVKLAIATVAIVSATTACMNVNLTPK